VVMGAHNIPVASPTLLPRLVAAFDAVRGGKVQPSPDSPGKLLYKVDDISFVMCAPSAHYNNREDYYHPFWQRLTVPALSPALR